MKLKTLFAVLCCLSTFAARAELITYNLALGTTTVITVGTNETMKILGAYGFDASAPNTIWAFTYGTNSGGLYSTNSSTVGTAQLTSEDGSTRFMPYGGPALVAGPVTLHILANNKSTVTVDITRATPSAQIANTVVIPDDGGGPVQIILEQSTDLVTWTAANPGSYGTTTQKRFFRMRAVRQ